MLLIIMLRIFCKSIRHFVKLLHLVLTATQQFICSFIYQRLIRIEQQK